MRAKTATRPPSTPPSVSPSSLGRGRGAGVSAAGDRPPVEKVDLHPAPAPRAVLAHGDLADVPGRRAYEHVERIAKQVEWARDDDPDDQGLREWVGEVAAGNDVRERGD